MSQYQNNNSGGQQRSWSPQGGQRPFQQNATSQGYQGGGGGDRAPRREGRSQMKGPLRKPGICRNGGHEIPAGTCGVRFDYDNRDAQDQATLECPAHFVEFAQSKGWELRPEQIQWANDMGGQFAAEQKVEKAFGGYQPQSGGERF